MNDIKSSCLSSAVLYLIPNFIGDEKWENNFPEYNKYIIQSLQYFIAEESRSCRYLLKHAGYKDISKAIILEYNEHHDDKEIDDILQPLYHGHSMGLVSEAGCPVLADPGDMIVRRAHQNQISVRPLIGPSAIMMAIMTAGLSGNNFAFCGYLPIDTSERIKKIKELEQFSCHKKQAQFFIETPYRNQKTLQLLIQVLHPNTLLSICAYLQTEQPIVIHRSVKEWKQKSLPDIQKKPCVFGIMKNV